MNALLIALPLLIGSCSDENNSYNDPATVPTDIIQTVVKTTADLSLTVTTDKAAYKPVAQMRVSEGSRKNCTECEAIWTAQSNAGIFSMRICPR